MIGSWRLLLKNWLIKVSSSMMSCNFVDLKHKQGFLQDKHSALNMWIATGLCYTGFGYGGIQLGWAPFHSSFSFRLILSFCFWLVRLSTVWFVWVWIASFLMSTGLYLAGCQSFLCLSCSLTCLSWDELCCVIGSVPWALIECLWSVTQFLTVAPAFPCVCGLLMLL